MARNRILTLAAAALGLAALVPIATAIGDDAPGDSRIESATALTTTFTYQGRLADGGSPANGPYDLRFILYDAESGGAQVGATVTKDDVPVANGLFTVDLDFGPNAFRGDARWMEIAVRPGTSTGTYTVLSPRQPVSPAPYALFAVAAGSLKVPLTVTGTSAGVPFTTEDLGLVTVNQEGTGIAIAGLRTTTDSAAYPAVYGYNAGGGAAIQGETTATNGIGVQAFATQGTAGKFVGQTALDLDGAIKVSGGAPAAFVHTVNTAGASKNTCADSDKVTFLDHPLLNGKPDAIVLITPRADVPGGTTGPADIGVSYRAAASAPCTGVADRWVIYTTGPDFADGATFNVLVISQ